MTKTRTCYEYEENRHDYDSTSQVVLYAHIEGGSNGNNDNHEIVGDIGETKPETGTGNDDKDNNIGDTRVIEYGPDLEPINHVIIGLRIRSIKTYDGAGNKLIKERRFAYAESGCTIDFTKIGNSSYLTRSQDHASLPGSTIYNIKVEAYQTLTFSDNSVLPGASPENARIFYNDVTEYIIDGQDPNNIVKVKYIYDCNDSQAEYTVTGHWFGNSSPDKWWEYISIPGAVSGTYKDSTYTAGASEIGSYFMEKKPTFGNIKNKITYKTQSDGQFVPVEEEINKYKKFNTERIWTGLYVKNIMSNGTVSYIGPMGIPVNETVGQIVKDLPGDCHYFDVYEEASCWKLVSSQRIKYFDSESTNGSSEPKPQKSNTTDYYYNGASIITPSVDQIGGSLVLPEEIDNTVTEVIVGPGVESVIGANINLITFQPKEVVHHIDGDVYRHRYKYTSDFATSGSVYADMKANNNIYTVVEESIIKNNTYITSIRNEFKNFTLATFPHETNWATAKLASRTKMVNGQETGKYTVHNYDMYGNPACVSVNGMAPTCYIWGYGNKYPVAEIKNATYQQIKDALGELAIHNIIESPTLSDILLQRLNNLRNTLPDALITIYTYEPMRGISSITDPSGRTTTFHYDEAGRLNATKDVNGNIIETYEYKNM